MAGLEEIRAVGQLEGHGGVLLDEHDGEAPARQLANGARDLAHDDGGEAERRLVEEQALGLGHEPAPDGQHLLLAARERAAALLEALAEPRKELVHVVEIPADVAPVPPLIGAHPEIVQHGELREDLSSFRHEHEAALDALEGQETRDGFAQVADVPGRRRLESRDHSEGGGLARRVRPDQAHDLPTLHLEAHVVKDVDLGVVAVDAVKLEHGPPRGKPRSPPAR